MFFSMKKTLLRTSTWLLALMLVFSMNSWGQGTVFNTNNADNPAGSTLKDLPVTEDNAGKERHISDDHFTLDSFANEEATNKAMDNITLNAKLQEVFTVTFTVSDEADAPIEGATISIADTNDDLTTDSDGIATIELEAGTYTYNVTATGYDDIVNAEFTVLDDLLDIEITLREENNNEVATLAELREQHEDGTIYLYTGEATLVAQDDHRNRKFLQDETAAIMLDDDPGIITTDYNLYDVITGVSGQLNTHNNMLQFQPDMDTGDAIDNAPVDPYLLGYVSGIRALSPDDQSKLVKLVNIVFTQVDGEPLQGGEVFENETNYTISDGDTTMIFRTDFWDIDLIGEEVPEHAVNITGVVLQHFDDLQIVPRMADDVEEYVAYEVTFNVNMEPADDFDPEDDAVYITGSMIDWKMPGDLTEEQTMTRVDDSMIWTVTMNLMAGTYEYKYFINRTWEGGEWGGPPNRVVEVTGNMVIDEAWADLVTYTDHIDLASLNVFPNPARDNVTITSNKRIEHVTITDITGKVVYTDVVNDTQTRIYNDLKAGIYMVSIHTEEGVFTRKLQIQQ